MDCLSPCTEMVMSPAATARTASRRIGFALAAVVAIIIVLTSGAVVFGQCVYLPGDVNNDGRVGISDPQYMINYFKAIGPPPPVSCDCPPVGTLYVAADVNGSCSVNAADVTYLVRYLKGIGPDLSFCANCPPSGTDITYGPSSPALLDIGLPDSVIIGNLNGGPVTGAPGDTVEIPVWVKNDESVPSLSISMATDNQYVASRVGGTLFAPLTQWDDCSFLSPVPDQPISGFTSQAATGWSDLSPGANPILNTGGAYVQVAKFAIVINPDTMNIGDTTSIGIGVQPRIGGAVFVDSSGTSEWEGGSRQGTLVIVRGGGGGCSYVPGDANGDDSFNGIDVQYSVNWFKLIGPAPPDSCNCGPRGRIPAAADANGNCEYNGIDVQYSVNWFKLIGPAPLGCSFCPPTLRVQERPRTAGSD